MVSKTIILNAAPAMLPSGRGFFCNQNNYFFISERYTSENVEASILMERHADMTLDKNIIRAIVSAGGKKHRSIGSAAQAIAVGYKQLAMSTTSQSEELFGDLLSRLDESEAKSEAHKTKKE